MNYYIADTHFGHKNIIKYDYANGSRNFTTIEEHDKLIINNINEIVTPQDFLYFLGDISWYNPEKTVELLKQINCRNLFAFKGNHDRCLKDGRVKKMFQGIYDIKQINDNDRPVILCHFPIMMYPGQHRGTIHLYGHVHNTKEETDYQEFVCQLDERIKKRDSNRYNPVTAYNVGAMLPYMDYNPRTLDQIMEGANAIRRN